MSKDVIFFNVTTIFAVSTFNSHVVELELQLVLLRRQTPLSLRVSLHANRRTKVYVVSFKQPNFV